jgi:hypothetical protein
VKRKRKRLPKLTPLLKVKPVVLMRVRPSRLCDVGRG